MRFDLHVHTTLSPCSELTVRQILDHAQSKGLDGVCITDHNTMAVRHQLTEGIQPNGLCVIFGLEYSTSDGDFLLFGPFSELPQGLPAADLLRLVRMVGGVAVAAHPFREGRSTSEELIDQGLCGIIEAVNGRNTEEENLRAAAWQEHYGVKMVGGSDAHNLNELGRITTRMTHAVTSGEDLVSALRHGAFSLEQPADAIIPLPASPAMAGSEPCAFCR